MKTIKNEEKLFRRVKANDEFHCLIGTNLSFKIIKVNFSLKKKRSKISKTVNNQKAAVCFKDISKFFLKLKMYSGFPV